MGRNAADRSGTLGPAARSFPRAYPSLGSACFCFLGGDFKLMDQRAYLNRMLRLALPFFRRRNILRENASSNARYPGLVGYAISCSSCAVDMDQ